MGWYLTDKSMPELCESTCRICDKEIGADAKIYFEDAKNNKAVHFLCAWQEEERRREQMRKDAAA